MALTERSRSALYLGLSDLIDEQAVQEMLTYFPARDVEEPVTKEYLRAELAEVRVEIAVLRADVEKGFRTMQAWMVGTGLSLGGLVIAVNAVFN